MQNITLSVQYLCLGVDKVYYKQSYYLPTESTVSAIKYETLQQSKLNCLCVGVQSAECVNSGLDNY